MEKDALLGWRNSILKQRMTEAEHIRPNLKFFGNQPSASATEVFCETIGLVIYSKIFLELCLSPNS